MGKKISLRIHLKSYRKKCWRLEKKDSAVDRFIPGSIEKLVDDFEEMTNLPKTLRQKLEAAYEIRRVEIGKKTDFKD
mgnify:CR=1 FL=1